MSIEPFVFIDSADISVIVSCMNCIFKLEKIINAYLEFSSISICYCVPMYRKFAMQ
jgi:hypothetical protein